MENALGKGLNSAIDAMRLQNETQNASSTRGLQAAQTQQAEAQAIASAADAKYKTSSAKNTDIDTVYKEKGLSTYEKEQAVKSIHADYDKKAAPYDALNRRLKEGLDSANSAKDLINPFKGSLPKGLFRTKDGKSIFRKDTGERLDLP